MKSISDHVRNILSENESRHEAFTAPFHPISGEGSLGERFRVELSDFAISVQWLPVSMMKIPFIRKLVGAGSISNFIDRLYAEIAKKDRSRPVSVLRENKEEDFRMVSEQLVRLRLKHDFPFWAATLVKIKNKEAGDDVFFRLRYPQRILISRFEKCRLEGKPIRIILLKARQWGGSTATQLYMAWLQFFHQRGLNSLIIAHQGAGSDEIKDMFDRMIDSYPIEFLYDKDSDVPPQSENIPKMVSVGKSGSTSRVPQRNCKIKIGTAERPDGCRGGDYSLVHLSEVGLWKKTEGKSPEDIVRSACSGILYRPLTMIVMESTANGTGNFFHSEYLAAANPDIPSQFEALFIPWFLIEQYTLPFSSESEKEDFAEALYQRRLNPDAPSLREESGRYLWWLWEKGASLEAIHWYVNERAGKNDHAVMAAEYPSDDEEAFVHSGSMVFDKYLVKALEATCRQPRFIGEIQGKADEGPMALENLHFVPDSQGRLALWALPDADDELESVSDRYITVVDVGGRTAKADFSVILVLDRIGMLDGEGPAVVAQWYGHCDIDILAWKAAQIAAFYDNSLLVIESNTIETHDRERHIEGGDQSLFILSQISSAYGNLYARRQSQDEIRLGVPRKYGFHTNVSTKPMIISTLVKAVRDKMWVERDRRLLDELNVYERKPNGAYGAIIGHHDDLLMTRAIGLHICFYEMDPPALIRNTAPQYYKRRGPVSEAIF